MAYKLRGFDDQGQIYKKVNLSPMILVDPTIDQSETAIWKRAYTVNKVGIPTLFGDEQIFAEFENRKATLEVEYKNRSRFKHTRVSWRIFFTNYRIIATLPADEVPGVVLGLGTFKPGRSLTIMAVSAAFRATRDSIARIDVKGLGVFVSFHTNFQAGMIKLDRKEENFKVSLQLNPPAHPVGKNEEYFSDGTWYQGVNARLEIEQFSTKEAAIEFLNKLYETVIDVKQRYFEMLKKQGRLSPDTTEDAILDQLNAAREDPIHPWYSHTRYEIWYRTLYPIDPMPFLPTNLESFGVKTPAETVLRTKVKLERSNYKQIIFERK